MEIAARTRLSLFLLRIGVFKKFYQLDMGAPAVFYVLGTLELALLALFVTGTAKRYSYGAVLLLHAVSTVSSYRQYLQPFDNLLFFAAWPMLAACIALYLLREQDTLWTLRGRRA